MKNSFINTEALNLSAPRLQLVGQPWFEDGHRTHTKGNFGVNSYYQTMRHDVLLSIINELRVEDSVQSIVRQYLELPDSAACGVGMVAGGSLSPLLGALYLLPLDKIMEQRVANCARRRKVCGVWQNAHTGFMSGKATLIGFGCTLIVGQVGCGAGCPGWSQLPVAENAISYMY